MGIFKSREDKVLDRFSKDYFVRFQDEYQFFSTQYTRLSMEEMKRIHNLATRRAYKNLSDRGVRLLGADDIALSLFPIAVKRVGWIEPRLEI